jgi:WD40 repeat protein
VLVLHGHKDTVRCLAYAPDGRRLASGGDDSTLRLWDLPSGTEAHALSTPDGVGGPELLARRAAAGGHDGRRRSPAL